MEKIIFNNEQLEFLKFIVQDFEYNDDHERYMIEQIENKSIRHRKINHLNYS